LIQPNNPDVLANLGFIYSERGESEEAEKLLRRAICLDPRHFPAHYDLGRLLVRLRRYNEALPILERGASLTTTDPGIHYQLFTVCSRLKRKADADRELSLFKRLEEARKNREAAIGGSATNELSAPVAAEPDSPGTAEEKP
jgi:Flp pilus assembly protein TadD